MNKGYYNEMKPALVVLQQQVIKEKRELNII